MKVIVLGGGVVGVTTAYQLQKDGHDVTVVDRQPVVAGETSWGNAGMVAPGHSFVWSSPKAPIRTCGLPNRRQMKWAASTFDGRATP